MGNIQEHRPKTKPKLSHIPLSEGYGFVGSTDDPVLPNSHLYKVEEKGKKRYYRFKPESWYYPFILDVPPNPIIRAGRLSTETKLTPTSFRELLVGNTLRHILGRNTTRFHTMFVSTTGLNPDVQREIKQWVKMFNNSTSVNMFTDSELTATSFNRAHLVTQGTNSNCLVTNHPSKKEEIILAKPNNVITPEGYEYRYSELYRPTYYIASPKNADIYHSIGVDLDRILLVTPLAENIHTEDLFNSAERLLCERKGLDLGSDVAGKHTWNSVVLALLNQPRQETFSLIDVYEKISDDSYTITNVYDLVGKKLKDLKDSIKFEAPLIDLKDGDDSLSLLSLYQYGFLYRQTSIDYLETCFLTEYTRLLAKVMHRAYENQDLETASTQFKYAMLMCHNTLGLCMESMSMKFL